jgi:hypothetical protein
MRQQPALSWSKGRAGRGFQPDLVILGLPTSGEAQSDPQLTHSLDFTHNKPGIYILRSQVSTASRNPNIPWIFHSKPFRIYILPTTL